MRRVVIRTNASDETDVLIELGADVSVLHIDERAPVYMRVSRTGYHRAERGDGPIAGRAINSATGTQALATVPDAALSRKDCIA